MDSRTNRGLTRIWIWSLRTVVVVVLFAIAIGALAGEPLILVPAIVLAIASGWLIDPRRSWWGPGPGHIFADPEARQRWVRSETTFFVIAIVAMLAFVIVVLASTT